VISKSEGTKDVGREADSSSCVRRMRTKEGKEGGREGEKEGGRAFRLILPTPPTKQTNLKTNRPSHASVQ
jgi:hypothetical protein